MGIRFLACGARQVLGERVQRELQGQAIKEKKTSARRRMTSVAFRSRLQDFFTKTELPSIGNLDGTNTLEEAHPSNIRAYTHCLMSLI